MDAESYQRSLPPVRQVAKIHVDDGLKQASAYLDIRRALTAYRASPTEETALALLLSGCLRLFPSLRLNFVAVDETILEGEGEDIPSKSYSDTIQASMTALCLLAKPLTKNNAVYLSKRWGTAVATAQAEGLHLEEYSTGKANDLFLSLQPLVQRHISRRDVAQGITMPAGDLYPLDRIVRAQVELVYHGAGMLAVDSMADFCAQAHRNLSITIASVLSQRARFIKLYEDIKAKISVRHDKAWSLARSLFPDELTPLATANFPDLYLATIESLKASGMLAGEQFEVSNHRTVASSKAIKRRAQCTIGGAGLSREIESALQELGVDLDKATQSLKRLRSGGPSWDDGDGEN